MATQGLKYEDVKQAQTQPGFNLATAAQAATLPVQVNTAQPNPQTVTATPYTQPQQPAQPDLNSLIGTRPSQADPNTTEYFNQQTGQGFANPQDLSTYLNQQGGQTTPQNVFDELKKGYQAATASGKQAPQNMGEAQTAIKDYTPTQSVKPQLPAEVSNFFQTNPLVQPSLQELTEFLSPASTRQTLTESMTKIVSGQKEMAGLNLELADVKRIMGGSEQDIRDEITKAGGFGTESQIQALTVGRNKTLLQRANVINDQLENMQNVINSDITMYGFQKDMAQQEFQQRSFLLNYKQQNDQFIYKAQQDALQRNLDLLGADGLYNAAGGDPVMVDRIERALGLASGGLYFAAQEKAREKAMKAQEQELNMMHKLAQIEDISFGQQMEKAKFDKDMEMLPLEKRLKEMQIRNIQSEISNRGKPEPVSTQVVEINGKKVLINSQTGEIINEIGSDPIDKMVKMAVAGASSWGDAANRINELFGDQTAASKYDEQLKAIYQQGQSPEQAFKATAPGVKQQLAAQKDKIETLDRLVNRKDFANAVATTSIGRWNIANMFTGEKTNFIADIETLRAGLTLDELRKAKEGGATFGSLTEGEWQKLEASATKISNWAQKDNTGKVVGYNTTDKAFREELQKIYNFAKLDYVLKNGNPAEVGIEKMPNGKYVAKNPDGSFQEF